MFRFSHNIRDIGRVLVTLSIMALVILPTVVLAQVDNGEVFSRCWTKEACTAQGGIWGKSDDYKNGLGHGKIDNFFACNELSRDTARCFGGNPSINLQVALPGVSDRFCSDYKLGKTPVSCKENPNICVEQKLGKCRPGITGGFPNYIKKFYEFFVTALAVIAVVMVMWGGFKRIMAAGNAEKITNANDTIFGAITGLVIALISFSLLSLINPRLIENTMPPIELVKPDFFGFCPSYEKAKISYESGWKMYKCVGGTKEGMTCIKDADCADGKCLANDPVETRQPGDTCGAQLVLDGRECLGQECTSGSQGCFKDSGGKKYRCSNVMFKGNLSGIEVNKMRLQIICSNTNPATGADCAIESSGGEGTSVSVNVEGVSYYAIRDCLSSADNSGKRIRLYPSRYCSTGTPKGYALLVEVESSGLDDWYAINASSCGSKAKKITGQNIYQDQPFDNRVQTAPYDYRIVWSEVDASKLFNPVDANGNLTKIIDCDLNITRDEFRDR